MRNSKIAIKKYLGLPEFVISGISGNAGQTIAKIYQ
jgi:hypothetical protein